jgi:hypothetical protein
MAIIHGSWRVQTLAVGRGRAARTGGVVYPAGHPRCHGSESGQRRAAESEAGGGPCPVRDLCCSSVKVLRGQLAQIKGS